MTQGTWNVAQNSFHFLVQVEPATVSKVLIFLQEISYTVSSSSSPEKCGALDDHASGMAAGFAEVALDILVARGKRELGLLIGWRAERGGKLGVGRVCGQG
jgi:hypothetical protein